MLTLYPPKSPSERCCYSSSRLGGAWRQRLPYDNLISVTACRGTNDVRISRLECVLLFCRYILFRPVFIWASAEVPQFGRVGRQSRTAFHDLHRSRTRHRERSTLGDEQQGQQYTLTCQSGPANVSLHRIVRFDNILSLSESTALGYTQRRFKLSGLVYRYVIPCATTCDQIV